VSAPSHVTKRVIHERFVNLAGLVNGQASVSDRSSSATEGDKHYLVFTDLASGTRDRQLLRRFVLSEVVEIKVILICVLCVVGRYTDCGTGESVLTSATLAGTWPGGPVFNRTARSLTEPVNGTRIILHLLVSLGWNLG
jgi:hypothetical protein